jgi:HAE1 family hydrophobic/amphiphilic exporter-1
MKLSDVSIARPVFATMMIAVILVFGLNALPKMGIEMFPNIEFPVITVLTVYPGADPTAVEEKISRKIEEAVNTLPDLDKLISYSDENVSQVAVQFKLNVPIDRALQDVRDKVASVRHDLPQDIEDPLIEKLDLGAIPIVTYSVSGPDDMSRTALTHFADKVIKENIEKVSGVGKVELIGGHPREIHLLVDLTALNAANLAVDDLMRILQGGNIELPGGRFDQKTRELSLRVDNQIRDPREIGDIVLTQVNGAPIYVRDVANVVDTEKDPRSYAMVNGRSAVLVQVLKQSGTNIVATADAVKQTLEKMRPTFPQGVKVNLVIDDAKFIREAIKDSLFDLIYGAILAVLIIGFFLRNRNMTLISAIAIPTSIIGTFSVLQRLNFTFNYLTMLALSLSVGIVIDDAIVVIENIFRHMEAGEPAMSAARKATAEIGLAVMATTFTIVAVFVPVAFMQGIMGRFFYQFGVTVALAVLISLFVSFTLTPMLASRFVHHQPKHGRFYVAIERLLKGLDAGYARLIHWALRNRGKVALIAIALLVLSVLAASQVPGEFMSQQDEERFQITVETPPGSTLAHTEQLCRVVESIVGKLPGVELIATTVGGGARELVNQGTLFVRLTPADKRPYSQKKLMAMIREKLPNLPGALLSVNRANEISSGQRPEILQFAIRGDDLPKMEAAAVRVAERLKKIPGFVDVDTSVRPGKDELRLHVDRQKAAQMGVSPAQVALAVRNLVSSAKVGEMAQGEDRYDIRVWLSPNERSTTADLGRIKIRNMMGGMVPLTDLVTIASDKGPTEIERQERQRQVTIYANLDKLAMTEAQKSLNAIAAVEVPPGFNTKYIGQAEMMGDAMRDMINALVLAIILVYIILASQFDSFLHPFTIMFSLPFSVIGAFGALLITGSTLSIISMIGIIMLMGLVTKNAILLVDRANQNIRAHGLERNEALVDAGRVRLRPILMTTFAMIFGMLPVAMALSKGSEIRSPMATAVIGGLITSTLLTLIVVPVIYTFLDDLSVKVTGLFRHRAPAPATAPAGGKE